MAFKRTGTLFAERKYALKNFKGKKILFKSSLDSFYSSSKRPHFTRIKRRGYRQKGVKKM
jgi:hypothetical protein